MSKTPKRRRCYQCRQLTVSELTGQTLHKRILCMRCTGEGHTLAWYTPGDWAGRGSRPWSVGVMFNGQWVDDQKD